MSADGSNRDLTDSKVGRLIETYALDGLGGELAEQWTAPPDDRVSLRELADVFNRRLLAAALEEASVETIDGEVENTYRLLTADDVTAGVRTEVRNRLDREGIDVDALETDFVSHQAIHTYLTSYREVTLDRPEQSAETRREKELETIRRLQRRTAAVTQDSVDRLAAGELLEVGDADVFVDVRVFCDECGGDFTVDELLRRGGCHCA